MNVEGSPNTDPTKKVLSNSGASGTCRHTLPLRTRKTPEFSSPARNKTEAARKCSQSPVAASELCNSTDALRVLETAGTVFIFVLLTGGIDELCDDSQLLR